MPATDSETPSDRSPCTRLPSFKAARDLSLKSSNTRRRLTDPEKQRRVFTPNVNVQRMKNRDTVASKSSEAGKERPFTRSSNNRLRQSPSLVPASASVFSEGVAVTKHSCGARHTVSSSNYPALKLEVPPVNKEEEEALIRRLLRGDFIQDLDLVGDSKFAPLSLPLSEYAKGKAAKNEKYEYDIATKDKKKGQDELSDIFCGSQRQQILIQLPDRLPCLPASVPKEVPSFRTKFSQLGTNQERSSKAEPQYCSLQDLSPGLIGELCVRKSGKVELVLDSCVLLVNPGAPASFRQDLVATQLNPATLGGEALNFGRISHRLICTPEWKSLLKTKAQWGC